MNSFLLQSSQMRQGLTVKKMQVSGHAAQKYCFNHRLARFKVPQLKVMSIS